jgi:uncharacterized protein YqgC (DUF456 family)
MGDYFLLIAGSLMMLVGILGCLLPVLPGPPLSWVGLLLLNISRFGNFSFQFLVIMAVVAVVVTVLDYVVPVWGTKRFGGSRAGIWGATLGLIGGIFFMPPAGIILGPFLGALIGELIIGTDSRASVRSAFGSFVGFLLGTGLKLIASFVMTWYFVVELIK